MTTEYINAQPWRQQYEFNEETLADITAWTTGTSIPGTLYGSSVIVTKNRVYLLGGNNGSTDVPTVYTAAINTDGTLGTWTTGTALPVGIYASSVVMTKNRVYLLGGRVSGTTASATVYTAPINTDGTLGTWTTGTSLPAGVYGSSVVVTKNRVYMLGGYTSTVVPTVYTAPINTDGTLGTWTTGTSLPAALRLSAVIKTKNRVYLLGGLSDPSTVSAVYTAPINIDGTLGTWTTGTSLPGTLFTGNCSIVIKNRVYMLGGGNGSASVSTVYTAAINTDGTLGTWTTGTALPVGVRLSTTIVTSSKVYIIGGFTTVAVSTIYTASFPGGFNDYLNYSWVEVLIAVRAILDQIYGLRLLQIFNQPYGDAARLRSICDQPYSDAARLRRKLDQLYGDSPRYRAALEQLYNLQVGLRATCSQPYAIAEGQIRAAFAQLYNLQDRDLIRATLDMLYVLAAGEALVQRFNISVVCDGDYHTSMGNINIEQDDQSFYMVGELQLYSRTEAVAYKKFSSSVVITVNAAEYYFIPGMVRESRQPGQDVFVVPLYSPTTLLQGPHSKLAAGELSGMAADIVAALAAPFTIDWQLVNWFIPPGRLAVSDGQAAIDVIRRITEAVGGIVQTSPAGVLVCRPEYPISVNQWANVTPDYYLTDQDDFFQIDHSPEQNDGYNKFNVSDNQLTTGGLTMEATTISATVSEERVYMLPWDDTKGVRLHHSGNPSRVSIVADGIEHQKMPDEQIEIVGGSGSTSKPFYTLISYRYGEADLGSLTIAEDGTITTAIAENSILYISYLSRNWKFTVTDNTVEDVQFFPEEYTI